MSHLPENELLSAYLDGELTVDERARVDRLLATDPAARRLLDELRAVSSALQSLPKQELGEDLRTEVLRLAERRMLLGEQPNAAAVDAAPTPLARSIFRRFVRPRTLAWTAIILAVALVIHFNEDRLGGPGHKAGREVALAPEKSAQPKTPLTIGPAPDSVVEERSMCQMEMPDEAKQDKAKVAQAERSTEGLTKGEPAMRGSGYGAFPPAASAPSAPSELAASKPAAADSAASRPKSADAAMGGIATSAPKDAVKKDEAKPEQLADADLVDADVLVVECDVSPEAVKKQTFDHLLTANGIAWQEDVAENRPATPAVVPPREAASKEAVAKTGEKLDVQKTPATDALAKHEKGKEEFKERATEQSIGGEFARPSDKSGKLDVVYVEATPAQIEATLAGLNAQPDAFLNVVVQPAPGDPSQRALSRYNRGVDQNRQAGEKQEQRGDAKQPSDNRQVAGRAGRPVIDEKRPAQVVEEEEEPLLLGAPRPGEESFAVATPSNARFRFSPQKTSQNEKMSQGFAQRVQLNAGERSDSDAAGNSQAGDNSQLMSPSRRSVANRNAVQRVQNVRGAQNATSQRDVQNRRAESTSQADATDSNVQTQRVVFVLREVENAPLSSETESKPAAVAEPASPDKPAQPAAADQR